MKKAINDYFTRPEEERRDIEYSYVDSFYPRIPIKLTNRLVNVAGIAWNNMLANCETCPNRCISERFEYCDMFDTYAAEGRLI
jgi:uncharacterized Fe-S radical SAM superfamily protein PflX